MTLGKTPKTKRMQIFTYYTLPSSVSVLTAQVSIQMNFNADKAVEHTNKFLRSESQHTRDRLTPQATAVCSLPRTHFHFLLWPVFPYASIPILSSTIPVCEGADLCCAKIKAIIVLTVSWLHSYGRCVVLLGTNRFYFGILWYSHPWLTLDIMVTAHNTIFHNI